MTNRLVGRTDESITSRRVTLNGDETGMGTKGWLELVKFSDALIHAALFFDQTTNLPARRPWAGLAVKAVGCEVSSNWEPDGWNPRPPSWVCSSLQRIPVCTCATRERNRHR